MIRPIITDRNKLTRKCFSVNNVQAAAHAIEDLLDTARFQENCAGLAAPQIGYQMRVIVVNLKEGFVPMIDPEFIEKSGKRQNGKEGCLSVPKTIENQVNVKRYYRVKIKYMNTDGYEVVKKFRSFEARVVQHEIDHLNGILI
jgi:peptide deformylase